MALLDVNNLDTTIHGPIRLGALSILQMDGPLDFTTIKKRLGVTDGSLGSHLRKLEDAGYIGAKKKFIGRRPNTSYRMTAKGRKAFLHYLNAMRSLVETVEGKNARGGASKNKS